MNAWIFQANPKRYDVVAAASRGRDDSWAMNQHRGIVDVGDRVYFYVSGKEAGVYAIGTVASPVFDAGESADYGRWKVEVQYDVILEPPLLRDALLADAGTADYPVFRGRQGTNFQLPEEVAKALAGLVGELVDELPAASDAPKDLWQDLERARRLHEQKVRQELLDFLKAMPPYDFERVVGVLSELRVRIDCGRS